MQPRWALELGYLFRKATRDDARPVQILGKFVVIACHRAERLAEGIIEGYFDELSSLPGPRATVGGCVHAPKPFGSQPDTESVATLIWKPGPEPRWAGVRVDL